MMKKLLLAFACLGLTILSQAQENPGFISIDCGATNNYTDETLGIEYTTDEGYVESGVNTPILPKYSNQFGVNLAQLSNIRVFPNGTRNCYTIRSITKNSRYLIRATFAYGNYDNKFQAPSFDLHIDVNYWGTVSPDNYTYDEIVYTPTRDYVQICLVNLGSQDTFISALELRLLDNSMYEVPSSIALRAWWRYNVGSAQRYRYPADVYDRIWESRIYNSWEIITNTTNIDVVNRRNNLYKVPAEVLMTAQQSRNGSYGMKLYWSSNTLFSWYVYLHFLEVETIPLGEFRQFDVEVNDDTRVSTVTPEYLKPVMVSTPAFSGNVVNYSVTPSSQSNVSSFINAAEIYRVVNLKNSPTELIDVYAMFGIKKIYGVVKQSWQGDPCVPTEYAWSGLICSSDTFPRILSLNLSSSRLSGNISDSFFNLTALTSLDLSFNQLSGQIPEFFAQMPNLKILNLSNNSLTGPIPPSLQQRVDNKTLTLSIHGNPICQNETENCSLPPSSPSPPPSEPPKKSSSSVTIGAVVGGVVGVLLILLAIFLIWRNKNKNKKTNQSMVHDQSGPKAPSWSEKLPESSYGDGSSMGDVQLKIVAKNRPFTSEEIVIITRNFSVVIGQGGFGNVYHGILSDGKEVAIKVLSQSSKQGYKEFQAEAQLLMVVHHKNLVSLVGYCEDYETMALIYEYMPHGDLRKYLEGDGVSVLSWSQRLQIAIEAAQGLDYLHNGCTPPIIHRDMKTSNILLDGNMQAKIADFGLSRVFATDSTGNQISTTRAAGTPGYIDPVFNSGGSFNKKSDVYSFGVIMFELITGKPAILRNSQSSTHIVKWATSLIDGGDIQKIVDSRIQGRFNAGSAWKAIEIAMQCVQMLPIQRPGMNRVVSDLAECLAMETGSRKIQGNEGFSYASTSSFDMTSLELDMGHMGPSAR